MASRNLQPDAEMAGPPGPLRALLPYRWEMIGLLWIAFFLNQGDRFIYSAVLTLIKDDLRLSDVQLGLVATVFTATYAILVPIAGYAGDILRRKWIVAGALLFWSTATLFTGVSSTLAHLIILRGLTTGGGEAFYYPAANSLIAQIHHRTRALAMAIHQTANYIGIVASGFLAGYIGQHYGWRSAFYVFGALGIAWAALLAWRLADTPQPAAEARASRPRIPLAVIGREVFGKATVWALCLGFAGHLFANIGYLTWMPTFLQEKHGLSPAAAGFTSMFYHHAAAMVGVLVGGRLSDRWAPWRKSVRIETEIFGLLAGAPFIVLVGLADGLVLSCVGQAAFGFFRGVYDSNLFAAQFDVIPARLRSSSVGFMLAFAFIVAAIAPLALGWVKTHFGLSIGIASLGGSYLAGGLAVGVGALFFFRRDYCEDTPADNHD